MIVAGNTGNMINLKKESIEVSKLLGADAAFITRPFFLQGLIYGALAGIISLLLLYLVCQVFSSNFFRIGFLPINLALIIILATALLGGVGSLISVRSHT
jgi:cell division transport system permease protein